MLAAGDVILSRTERGNDFALSLGGHDALLTREYAGLASISAKIPGDASVTVDLPAEGSISVQLLSCDGSGHLRSGCINAAQIAISAPSGRFSLAEAVPSDEALAPGHYVLRVMHKKHGEARVFFTVK